MILGRQREVKENVQEQLFPEKSENSERLFFSQGYPHRKIRKSLKVSGWVPLKIKKKYMAKNHKVDQGRMPMPPSLLVLVGHR